MVAVTAMTKTHTPTLARVVLSPAQALRKLRQSEPRLAAFGLLMLLLMVPALLGLALDERTLRDVNVWVKPQSFPTRYEPEAGREIPMGSEPGKQLRSLI